MTTINEQEFDLIFDCQKVFKEIMNALARPGKVYSIKDSSRKLKGEHKALTAAALTLMDNRCRYFAKGEKEWEEEIRERTLAVQTEAEDADFWLITGQEAGCYEILEKAKCGTLPAPHKAALIFVELESLTGGEEMWMEGPGIKDRIQTTLANEGRKWLKERDKQEYEYPCGVDFVFCTPEGEIMGVSRTVKAGGKEEWDM